jgi:hypothetical protein
MTEDDLTPPAEVRRGLVSHLEELKAQMKVTEENPVLSKEYKDATILQIKAAMVSAEDAIQGFDKLTHPIQY